MSPQIMLLVVLGGFLALVILGALVAIIDEAGVFLALGLKLQNLVGWPVRKISYVLGDPARWVPVVAFIPLLYVSYLYVGSSVGSPLTAALKGFVAALGLLHAFGIFLLTSAAARDQREQVTGVISEDWQKALRRVSVPVVWLIIAVFAAWWLLAPWALVVLLAIPSILIEPPTKTLWGSIKEKGAAAIEMMGQTQHDSPLGLQV